jgi:hypothetical protein
VSALFYKWDLNPHAATSMLMQVLWPGQFHGVGLPGFLTKLRTATLAGNWMTLEQRLCDGEELIRWMSEHRLLSSAAISISIRSNCSFKLFIVIGGIHFCCSGPDTLSGEVLLSGCFSDPGGNRFDLAGRGENTSTI